MTTMDVDPKPLGHEEEDLLRALARTLVFLPRAFIADLGREHDLSMSEFFTLMHLSEDPRARLRMGDIATATALSLGAVTRVVKLLEGKGLVERSPSAVDGRVHEAVLTEAGRRRLDGAHPAHVASVRRRILGKLDGIDVRMMTTALLRISEGGSSQPIDERTKA
ncbi:MAG: MarR family transcriptional regulator [Demequinaceae bacterium]|nr:MarR family transcriptional regulator [Demequinaceae bacterium]